MNDLGFAFLKGSLRLIEPCHFWRDHVFALRQVKFENTESLLDRDHLFIAGCKFLPCNEHLLYKLLNRVALEHPLKRCALVSRGVIESANAACSSRVDGHTGDYPRSTALELSQSKEHHHGWLCTLYL